MIPLQHGLILAAILFVLGLTGLVIRRNLLFMLIGLEIMINASALGSDRRSGDVHSRHQPRGGRSEYRPCAAAATSPSSPEPEHRFSK